ncbi:MAG: ribokinase [Chloroflexi bacterium]|nr:MAG: ribokinase [Chloroflexota bacterium]MBL1194214.1 ribokinase [Chloroflexota bacterium]NOH11507.1 ribokinase [Chloroflexota bacterium]
MTFLEVFDLDTEAPVIVLGAASIDFVGRTLKDVQEGTSNPAEILTSMGGTARNVAENLARLGQEVTLLSVVGDDNVGTQLLQHTEEAGVNVDHVIRTGQHPTSSYVAIVDSTGNLQMGLDDMRAIEALNAEYILEQEALFENASLLFIDANPDSQCLATAIEMAKKHGLPICADPTSRSLATKLQSHLKDIYLLTPNTNEAAIFCNDMQGNNESERGLNAARHLISHGVDLAIVTLAEFGLSYATSETDGHIPAAKIEIVDPTGAGDALSATVIFALLNEVPADEAVRLGLSAASLTLRHRGAVLADLSLELLYDELV